MAQPASISYDTVLTKQLKNRKKAAAYLTIALKESEKGDAESKRVFLAALEQVVAIRGGLEKVSKKAGVKKEKLHQLLHGRATIDLLAISAVIRAMGFDFRCD